MKQIIIAGFCLAFLAVGAQQQPTSNNAEHRFIKNIVLPVTRRMAAVSKMNPPLIKTSYVTGDKDKIIKWVLQGSVEHVPIDGDNYSNNMPAQKTLTDQQVADVLTYIRSSFGNKASAILPADVKAVRASLK